MGEWTGEYRLNEWEGNSGWAWGSDVSRIFAGFYICIGWARCISNVLPSHIGGKGEDDDKLDEGTNGRDEILVSAG